MQGAFFMGFVGPTIGGWIIEITDNLLSVFYVIFVVYIMTFFYFLFILPESITKEKLLENLNRQRESNSTFDRNQLIKSWIIYSIFKPLTIIFEKNNDNNNNNNKDFFTKYSLLILASINTLIMAAMMGLQSIFLLYVTLIFKWSLVDQGYYFLIIGISRVVVLMIIFPLLISNIRKNIILNNIKNNINNNNNEPIPNYEEKQLRKSEVWILRLALLIDTIAYVGYGLSTSSSLFIIGKVIENFFILIFAIFLI
jgi:MFS family permease